jgi:phosphoenolpyruvate carboxykinase (ATP)
MHLGIRSADLLMPSNENARRNLNRAELVEHAIRNQEGKLSPSGALLVKTGEYTGRAPNDKFIVDYRSPEDQKIHWGNINKPISPEHFEKLYCKVVQHLSTVNVYTEDVLIGAEVNHQRKIRVISEFAWAALFVRDLFIPSPAPFVDEPDFTVLHAPLVSADPLKSFCCH